MNQQNTNQLQHINTDHQEDKLYGMAASLLYECGQYCIKGRDLTAFRSLIHDPVIAPLVVNSYDDNGHFSSLPPPTPSPLIIGTASQQEYREISDGSEMDVNGGSIEISLTILRGAEQTVKERAREIGLPLLEEFAFRSSRKQLSNDLIPGMWLKASTKLRSYQSHALGEVFDNATTGRVRSGMIVLPCGAGKTLTAITAACTMRPSSVLILTTNTISVRQWQAEFHHWTDIPSDHVHVFTSNSKETDLPYNCVLISTYQMISFSGDRSKESKTIMDILNTKSFDLVILDEAHVVPAPEYSRAVSSIKAHCKLGLTATMVREDDKINDLQRLVGPRLYTASWSDLTSQGYLANVRCIDVPCSMPEAFMRAYDNEPNPRRKLLLSGANPRKLRTVEMLVRRHEANGDKIIVFSDSIFTLRLCALMLSRPFIYGETSQDERQVVLGVFRRETTEIQTVCLSKVGDVAIDIPKASVVIQVTSDNSSRRAEAQRLGRILRPKFLQARTGSMNENTEQQKQQEQPTFDAFFYSLVSTDTVEETFRDRRQQFLVDQGYAFERMNHLCEQADRLAVQEDFTYSTPEDEQVLLEDVLEEMERRYDVLHR